MTSAGCCDAGAWRWGLSQEELAERATLSVRAIRDAERGATRRPYRHTIGRLADALGLTGADRAEFSRTARRVRDDAGPPGGPRGLRQLPDSAADFTGRSAELKTLAGLLYREVGQPHGEVKALNGLGEAFLAIGQPGPACDHYTAALSLARQTADTDQQARAHHGLGQASRMLGDTGQARHHWAGALVLYTSLGASAVAEVKACLAALGPDPQ